MRIVMMLFVLLLLIGGCSSSALQLDRSVQGIFWENLHFRRPTISGADPQAQSTLEEGYLRTAKVSATLDCEPMKFLFKSVDFALIRSCLADLSKLQSVKEFHFELVRDIMPYFKLDDSDEVPACVTQSMSVLPVPREIVYQTNEKGSLSCYSSRIPVADEEFMGIKAFLFRTRLTIGLPLPHLPGNDRELVDLLTTWAITPFYDDNGRHLLGEMVPTSTCGVCMNRSQISPGEQSLPPTWPENQL